MYNALKRHAYFNDASQLLTTRMLVVFYEDVRVNSNQEWLMFQVWQVYFAMVSKASIVFEVDGSQSSFFFQVAHFWPDHIPLKYICPINRNNPKMHVYLRTRIWALNFSYICFDGGAYSLIFMIASSCFAFDYQSKLRENQVLPF